jgi:hypothetical protein
MIGQEALLPEIPEPTLAPDREMSSEMRTECSMCPE